MHCKGPGTKEKYHACKLESHPEILLEASAGELGASPQTFYRPDGLKGRVFAHGRDPNFPAWQDTVQVNWFSDAARHFMTTIPMGLTRRMVVVNLSDKTSTCQVRMNVKGYSDKFTLEDILNGRSYLRSSGEAARRGLYVELGAYHGHIFRY